MGIPSVVGMAPASGASRRPGGRWPQRMLEILGRGEHMSTPVENATDVGVNPIDWTLCQDPVTRKKPARTASAIIHLGLRLRFDVRLAEGR